MSRTEQKHQYVDLKTDGRMLPSWLLDNFRKYELPEIIKKEGVDPCNNRDRKVELRRYQKFIAKYLDFNSIHRSMLVYHGLGSGKTATAINVYNALYNYTPGWNVFILIKASLKGGWLADIQRWLSKDEYKFRYKNIIFVNYDSPRADKKFMEELQKVDASKMSLFIIDEVHNFIRNVYSNISSSGGKRAQVIYDYIIQNRKEDPNTRVVLLSATPAINKPFELALLFNLLRDGSFPKNESKFNHMFINESYYQTMNTANKNLFQRRILGLVSRYVGGTPDLYASKTVHYVESVMSEYQADIYKYYEDLEKEIAKKSRLAGQSDTVYKSYTRQASNFVFPQISQSINGENRPRPGKFRISERDAMKMMEMDKDVDESQLKVQKGSDTVMKVAEYAEALKSYQQSFDNYLQKIDNKDKTSKYTILDDYKVYLDKYQGDYDKFIESTTKRSGLFTAMHDCSSKMIRIIFTVMNSPGPCVVYSNYVMMEGLEMFKVYLKYFGFYSVMKNMRLQPGKVGYVEFHGGIKARKDRDLGQAMYNAATNKQGNQIKMILISAAGAEGLNLLNTRQVHIMEPYWNEVRVHQLIGRAIRLCSHAGLPMEDRKVDVFRYKAVRNKKSRLLGNTTDMHLEDLARSKDNMIQSFLDAIKEAAVDCELNKKHNMLQDDYKCFQFEEPSLFEKNIGPAFKEDIDDDMKMNNGSNSLNATTVRIKVMKIKARKRLSAPDVVDNVKYSKTKDYWYYADSGTVYDFDLHFAVGKVAIGKNDLPVKLDEDTYVIDKIVPIPVLDE